MKAFIVDKLNFWTLQFYRRLYCREPELQLVTIDPNWEKYIPKNAYRSILPHHWTKRFRVELDKTQISRQRQSYDTALALPGGFRPKPYSKYLVSFQYLATGENVTLSCNFFGENRDFKQQHFEIKELGVWRKTSIVLETEFFRTEEEVKLRFWPILSAPKTNIRIDDITVSMEPTLKEELLKHVSSSDEALIFWEDLPPIGGRVLASTDVYCSNIPSENKILDVSCSQSHKAHLNNLLCDLLGAHHDGKAREFMVDDNKLLSKDKTLVMPMDDSILLPCTLDFNFQAQEGISFVGTESVLEQIKNNFGLKHNARYYTLEQWEAIKSEVVVIADSLDSNIYRLILKCWSRGLYVISLVPLPTCMQGAPIHRAYLNDVSSFMSLSLERLNWLRETGFLIARKRNKENVREDLISYLENHV